MQDATCNIWTVLVINGATMIPVLFGQWLQHRYNMRKFRENSKKITAVKEEVLEANGKSCRYGNPPDPTTNPETHL